MATATNLDSSIRLKYSYGVDGDGHEISKRKTLSKVKCDSTNEDIYAVAQSIGGLQDPSLVEVVREDSKMLNE
ncbi:Protein of unknown function [Peptoclostridium litorale DSM 5388]|uniref:DUF1659 domain-containing protein n=1 Tax=Peptoclostridium litorale DSM 5388 TaxID=1121324 RepID=A0A069RIF3_PEPLI|nr:DUF1659 domain-containing protein [Peptoclostridium litorale]KDR96804.1 hypothetical protein CLIT_20p00170 [Peptoclostridium litorale DSM 5388]SIO36344.1 Protein of unknown function [Peptoclostridium litorale DSM 5388]